MSPQSNRVLARIGDTLLGTVVSLGVSGLLTLFLWFPRYSSRMAEAERDITTQASAIRADSIRLVRLERAYFGTDAGDGRDGIRFRVWAVETVLNRHFPGEVTQ